MKRALVDSRLHFDSGHLFCRIRFLIEPVWKLKAKELPEERINYVRTTYDILERFLANSPYLCGDDLNVADLCCVASISSIIRVVPLDTTEHAKVIEWMQRMAKLPYYEAKNAEGAERLQDIVMKMLKENQTHEQSN